MNDRHARYGAATGIVFVVLIIVGFFSQTKPPDLNASGGDWLNYFQDHRDAIHVGELIVGVASFMFIWFIGTLRSALAAAEGGQGRLAVTAYGAGLVMVAILIASFGLQATAALHPATNGPQLTHALVDAFTVMFALSGGAVGVFFVANSIVILRSGYLPAWLGWVGMLAALFNLLALGGVITDHGAFAPDKGILGFFAGFVFFLIWFLGTSIALMRRLGRDGAPGAAPAQ
jgi:hypothetical protein